MFRPSGGIKKNLLGAAGFSISGAAIGTGLAYNYDEGTKRSLQFWYNIFPLYVTYRLVQFLNRDTGVFTDDYANGLYDTLHNKFTDEVKANVYKMRGFYLKQAQLLSTQDDFVPAPYMRWVKDTQDNVPSEFFGSEARVYAAMMMKEEMGLDFDEVFESWDDVPLGVASIGQVHKAVLRKTKEVVAVKLLVPGIENRFRSDIRTLRAFCQLAMPQHVSGFAEIEKQFLTEFDYKAEADNLNRVRANVLPKWKSQVNIPKPHMDLCSRHILVMEYLNGVKLVDGIIRGLEKVAALQGKSVDELLEEQKAKITAGTLQYKSVEESRAELQKLKRVVAVNDCLFSYNPLRLLYNCSVLRLVTGPAQYVWTPLPVDLGGTLELLCKVEGNQIFADGLFNGDCHPGNVLLLDDGRLGLIDYGQVKAMTIDERIKYAKLIIAHSRGNKEEVVRIHFDEMGTVTKKRDIETAYLFSSFWNDRNTSDVCGDMNIASFIDHLEARDPMVKLPEEYIFAARVSVLLRGMGKAFGLNLRMSEMWKEEAENFLKSQGIDY
jgi:aarF domain-containing kinase